MQALFSSKYLSLSIIATLNASSCFRAAPRRCVFSRQLRLPAISRLVAARPVPFSAPEGVATIAGRGPGARVDLDVLRIPVAVEIE